MLFYSRFVPDDAPDFETALIDTVDHVRGHLSACASADDDECEFDELVQVSYTRETGDDVAGTLVTGALDAVATDEYALDELPVEPAADEEVVW